MTLYMSKCDGTEKHGHYKLDTDITIYHTHEHTVNEKDFNRLHHHPPVEHEKFSTEELEKDAEFLRTPF